MVNAMPAGIIALLGLISLLLLWQLIFLDIMVLALTKLGIPPLAGLFIVIGIFFGGFINLPLKRYRVERRVDVSRSQLFGAGRWLPREWLRRPQRVIAVNIGGCLVPLGVALYLLLRLAESGDLAPAALAIFINVIICFAFSRPEPDVGIVMPVLIPGACAALSAVLLHPQNTPAVAFCAGVLGPLIGADLLRLQQIRQLGVGIASIGGAGTFDGIVISGFIALLLA